MTTGYEGRRTEPAEDPLEKWAADLDKQFADAARESGQPDPTAPELQVQVVDSGGVPDISSATLPVPAARTRGTVGEAANGEGPHNPDPYSHIPDGKSPVPRTQKGGGVTPRYPRGERKNRGPDGGYAVPTGSSGPDRFNRMMQGIGVPIEVKKVPPRSPALTSSTNGEQTTTPVEPAKDLVEYTIGGEVVALERYETPEAPSRLRPSRYKSVSVRDRSGNAYRKHLYLVKSLEDAAADNLAEAEAAREYAETYKADVSGGVPEIQVTQIRDEVTLLIRDLVDRMLPEPIKRSAAAPLIFDESVIQGGTYLVQHSTPIEERARRQKTQDEDINPGEYVTPNVRNAGLRDALTTVRDQAVLHSRETIFSDITPLEAAQRVARALGARSVRDGEPELQVTQYSGNGDLYVDAMQAARLMEAESDPKLRGIVTGRSDESVRISREGTRSSIKALKATVGIMGDPESRDDSLVFALGPGHVPMAGEFVAGEEQTDFGELRIWAVGIHARHGNIDNRMSGALNAPDEVKVGDITEGGEHKETTSRRRIDLVESVRFFADPRALGYVKPKQTVQSTLQLLEAGDGRSSGDEDVHDAVIVDGTGSAD